MVVVDGGDVAALARSDDRRLFGVQPTKLELHGAKSFGQGVVVEPVELIDNGGQHGPMVTNTRSRSKEKAKQCSIVSTS